MCFFYQGVMKLAANSHADLSRALFSSSRTHRRFPPTRQQAAPQTESLTALGRFIRFLSTWDWVLG